MTLDEIESKIDKALELLGRYPHSSAIVNELESLCELKNDMLSDMGLLEEI